MVKYSINHEGGGGTKNLVMSVDEMREIMNYIAQIHNSFQDVINPKLAKLLETKYYEGGDASKAMKHYSSFLFKATEISSLYGRAYSEVLFVMTEWLQQDAALGQAFRDSLSSHPEAQSNISKMFGGGS